MNKKVFLFGMAAIFAACSSDGTSEEPYVDTEKPTVEIITPNEDQQIPLGEMLYLKAHLKDNVQLASYKIEIHSAEDGHHHRSETHPFTYNKQGTMESSESFIDQGITIPTDITPGHYHIGVFAIDNSGNQNQVFKTIVLGEDHD